MAGSKFFGIRQKKKAVKKEMETLPKNVEVKEELLVEPVIEQAELEKLLDSLSSDADELNSSEKNNTPVENEQTPVRSEELQDIDVTFTAYGIYFDDKRSKFRKISIDYSPITGYSKVREIVDWADSAPTALNKLNRILSLKLIKREEKI